MRTLLHRCVFVTLLAVVAAGLACQEKSKFEQLPTRAEQGDASGQHKLGLMYSGEGQGVPQDYAEAVKWVRMAAEQGHAEAQADLGRMYVVGRGVPQDYAEAVKWVRMAAEQGDAEAQANLGRMYAVGRGVPEDYLQAHMWVNLAASASQGEKNERFAKARKRIAEEMTSAQTAEAQRLAREWKPKTWDELKKRLKAESH